MDRTIKVTNIRCLEDLQSLHSLFYGMQGNRESTKLPSVQFFETNITFGNMSLKHLYHHSKLSYTVIVFKKIICCLKLFDQDITTDF